MPNSEEELKAKIIEAKNDIKILEAEREAINEQLAIIGKKLGTLRFVYEVKFKRPIESNLKLFDEEEKSSRFTGLRLTEALAILRKEKPMITREEAVTILEREGFSFRTKRHLSAVNFAWVALDNRKGGGFKDG